MATVCDECENTVDPYFSGHCEFCNQDFCEECWDLHDTTDEEAEYKRWYDEQLSRMDNDGGT